MPRQILFVQGGGEGVHDEWDNKLVSSLETELGAGYAVRYPRMPKEADPQYATWKQALIKELGELDDGAVLVGHSIGGTVLVHVLVEHRPKQGLSMIALIAPPFVGEGGWPSDDIDPSTDLAEQLPADVPIFHYHGTADDDVPFAHQALYAKAIPRATVRVLKDRDHQLNNDLSEVARDIRDALQAR
jgi:predicted alpha/beta hydrolase family esterase